MIFDEPMPESFVPSSEVFLTAHPGREDEYGIPIVNRIAPQCPDVTFHIYGVEGISFGNVFYHGKIAPHEFNNLIKHQHALRLNRFDGFAETLAKSITSGNYPISYIPYPFLDTFETDEELITLLCQLKEKKVPNPNRAWWLDHLENSLREVLT